MTVGRSCRGNAKQVGVIVRQIRMGVCSDEGVATQPHSSREERGQRGETGTDGNCPLTNGKRTEPACLAEREVRGEDGRTIPLSRRPDDNEASRCGQERRDESEPGPGNEKAGIR